MAAKTDAEIGNKVRTQIAGLTLGDNEEITKVKIITVVEVKNTVSNFTFTKGAKGSELNKYNADDEELNDLW